MSDFFAGTLLFMVFCTMATLVFGKFATMVDIPIENVNQALATCPDGSSILSMDWHHVTCKREDGFVQEFEYTVPETK